MLKLDGFDDALIGIATVWQKAESGGANLVDTLIYDGERIVTVLCEQSGTSYEEALEYISFNIEGAYVGEATPIIVWPCAMEQVDEIAQEQKESDSD